MAKTLSTKMVLMVKNSTIKLSGGWGECLGEMDRTGIVFIYGPSTSGKSSAALSLAKELTAFGRVHYASNEEGFRTSFQNRLRLFSIADCGRKITFTCRESAAAILERLGKQRSADFVIIDSVQDTSITRKEYNALKRMSQTKMFVFVSRIEGRQPMGRLARDIKFDADLKVWVEGGKAKSEGRYIGSLGYCDVYPTKSREYWGEPVPATNNSNE